MVTESKSVYGGEGDKGSEELQWDKLKYEVYFMFYLNNAVTIKFI